MSDVPAPRPTYRLIPSRFPPIGLFDTVATAADLAPVLDLAGWTNDRLVAERIARLPQEQWVYGRANSSVVMATFLHVAPGGMRFNGPDLGAWYAGTRLRTSVVEVAHHLRREAHAMGRAGLSRVFRTYTATLQGGYLDIRGQQTALPDVYNPMSYSASQAFGERLRDEGQTGIFYSSLRDREGENVVCFRPHSVEEVVQTDHYEITVEAARPRIVARKLPAKN